MTGKQFGRLTAIRPLNKRVHGEIIWKCKCFCGNEIEAQGGNLRTGNTKSCGCLVKEACSKLGKASLQDVSHTVINGIYVVRMSEKRTKNGGHAYCFATCPVCKEEWEVMVRHLKNFNSTQCRKCCNEQTTSKTSTALLDRLGDLLKLKVIREYQIENKYFDGYIPELNMLIESDGTYWHTVKENNDLLKDRLAKKAGLQLVRVINDSFMDHDRAINEIFQAIN